LSPPMPIWRWIRHAATRAPCRRSARCQAIVCW
jgi:hypothetical protein